MNLSRPIYVYHNLAPPSQTLNSATKRGFKRGGGGEGEIPEIMTNETPQRIYSIYIINKAYYLLFLRLCWAILVYNIWSTQSILVYFSLFWSTSVCPILLVYFGDTLGGEDFVKRGAASLIIMLQSQPNVSRFFIKLHFSCIIKVLYLFYYISDRFTYICFLFRSYKTYRIWTIC